MASPYSLFIPFSLFVALPAQGLLLPPEAQTPASTPNGGVHIGGYDQDGSTDFTIGSGLYRGDGTGRFVPTTIRGPVTGYVSTTGPVALAELDLDGDLDFIFADGVWMNGGGAYADETATRIGGALSAGAQIELVYDADGDGDIDLVASLYTGVSYYSLYLETAYLPGLVGTDLYAQSLVYDSGMRLRLSNRTATRIQ